MTEPTTATAHASLKKMEKDRDRKSVFDLLPDSALVREYQLVQSSTRPNTTAPLPFSAQTLGRMVKDGTFPAPIQLSKRVKCWRVSAVRAWMKKQGQPV